MERDNVGFNYKGWLMRLILLLLPIFFSTHLALAKDKSEASRSYGKDEQIDLLLGAIEPPNAVRRNTDLLNVLEILTGVPTSKDPGSKPPFKQEPPKAQESLDVPEE